MTPPEPALRVALLVGHAAGGIGRHVQSLATGLPATWQVVVLCPGTTAERFPVPAVDISAWPARTGRTWSGAWSAIRAWRRLRAWLREVDVVHAHGHQAGVLAVLAAATSRRRPRVVISWHNAVLGTGAARRVRALAERLQALRADLVTGASEDLVRRAAQLGAHAVLAPVAAPDAGTWSGDASAERRAVAQELGLDPEAAWALTVSRIAPQKNLDVLVEAAGRSKRSPLEWVVVGDGDEQLRSRLAAMVEDGGARVHLLGARRDVPRLMAVADVLVVPSAWEARALVVQEAMAAGLPVVATAVGGLPGLLDGAGVLVPPGDATALADAVAALVADPGRAAELARAGRRVFAALPDEAEVCARWTARYLRLVAGADVDPAGSGTHAGSDGGLHAGPIAGPDGPGPDGAGPGTTG